MSNTDVFKSYDIVVAITQAAVNRELATLFDNETLVLIREEDESRNYVYSILGPEAKIPEFAEYVSGSLLPQIEIRQSGTDVVLVLHLTGGTAGFWGGSRQNPIIETFGIDHWKFGITVSLNLAEHEGELPPEVSAQLTDFEEYMFSIQYLFLDLSSTDLANYQVVVLEVDSDEDAYVEETFGDFMAAYLRKLDEAETPYILGYSVTIDESPEDYEVPDVLQPCGATFNVYHDPANPEMSTINYVLVTKGGHKTVSGTPTISSSNWLASGGHDGRMILSSAIYTDYFILEPVFEQVREDVYEEVRKSVNVDIGNDYDAACSTTKTGYYYDIAKDEGGDNQYTNYYSVDIGTSSGQGRLSFSGYVKARKEKSKKYIDCKCEASATSKVQWSGSVNVKSATDAEGVSVLHIEDVFKTDSSDNKKSQNSCCDQWDSINKWFDDFFDDFDVCGVDFWDDLFAGVFEFNIDGIGDISVVTENLSSVLKLSVILPAGSVYRFTDVAFDSSGHLYTYVDYL